MADADADLAKEVRSIIWHHKIALPNGLVTPGGANNLKTIERLQLPADWTGKSVLDIGAWDGFYSFDAVKRGASRVMATDSFVWQSEKFGDRGFHLARHQLGLDDKVDQKLIDVMDLSPEALGETFDIVLFLGVLYHLRDPFTAIERVASVCRETLILESDTALNWLPYAAARLYPGTELADDETNWIGVNRRAVTDMLRQVGFSRIELKYRSTMTRRVAGAWKVRHIGGFRKHLRSQRMVLHAHR